MNPRMTLPRFEYRAPQSVGETSELVSRYGNEARIKAGGTDLLIRMRRRLVMPGVLVGLRRVPGLDGVTWDAERGLSIGAMATLNRVARDPHVRQFYPAAAYAASVTATTPIRNLGTVVGNLCNAAPSADNAPSLTAFGGRVVLASLRGERVMSLEEFFRGPGLTAREPDEWVIRIEAPVPAPGTGSSYQALSMRSRVDIAAVSAGAVVTVDGETCVRARIVLGAVAPVPLRVPKAEAALEGRRVTAAEIAAAARMAMEESCPITDCRACEPYRRSMVEVLTRRALAQAFEQAEATILSPGRPAR